jgi:hypothetical protein
LKAHGSNDGSPLELCLGNPMPREITKPLG